MPLVPIKSPPSSSRWDFRAVKGTLHCWRARSGKTFAEDKATGQWYKLVPATPEPTVKPEGSLRRRKLRNRWPWPRVDHGAFSNTGRKMDTCDKCGKPLQYQWKEHLSDRANFAHAIRAGVCVRSGKRFCGRACSKAELEESKNGR